MASSTEVPVDAEPDADPVAAPRAVAVRSGAPGRAVTADMPVFRGAAAPGRRCTLELVLAWVALVAVAVVVGRLIGDTTSLDTSVSEWFVRQRTGDLNVATRVFSLAGDTYTVIAIGSLVVLVALVRHRREGLVVLVCGMLGEVTIFLTITAIVSRPRPAVERLDGAPPTSSFPSGHTFAAIVLWGSLAIVATRTSWSPWLRRLFLALMILMPIAIAWSRLYRGMHHFTDVLASTILGMLWLVVLLVIFPNPCRTSRPAVVPEARPRPIAEATT